MAMVAVCLRLPSEVWTRHSAAAEKLGVPLATYLRQRLDEKDRSEAALVELRDMLEERTAASPPASEEQAATPSVLVEMLLILRQVGGPERARMAQLEIKRRGLEPWK